MKNVTISLDEELLKAARLKAAEAGVSFQEWVRALIAGEVKQPERSGLQDIWDLSDRIGAKSEGRYPTRDEIYAERLHRQQHLSVRERSQGSDKARKRKKTDR